MKTNRFCYIITLMLSLCSISATHSALGRELKSPEQGFGDIPWGDTLDNFTDKVFIQSITDQVSSLEPHTMCYAKKPEWDRVENAIAQKKEYRVSLYCYRNNRFVIGVKTSNRHSFYDAIYRWLNHYASATENQVDGQTAMYRWEFTLDQKKFVSTLYYSDITSMTTWLIANKNEINKTLNPEDIVDVKNPFR
jgi:hypothetical protein